MDTELGDYFSQILKRQCRYTPFVHLLSCMSLHVHTAQFTTWNPCLQIHSKIILKLINIWLTHLQYPGFSIFKLQYCYIHLYINVQIQIMAGSKLGIFMLLFENINFSSYNLSTFCYIIHVKLPYHDLIKFSIFT